MLKAEWKGYLEHMGKINIISNISSKVTRAGTPFCKFDDKKCKIENDKIVFFMQGEHNLI